MLKAVNIIISQCHVVIFISVSHLCTCCHIVSVEIKTLNIYLKNL